jgi:archaemetzincin
MNSTSIIILSCGHIKKKFLDHISKAVEIEFNCPVQIKDVYLDLSEYFDPSRRQYNGDKLMKLVDSLNVTNLDDVKIIGLFTVDLYIPILTYIFGQAQLNGKIAITSLYRLQNESYGMPENNQLLLDRFTKEVIHELGHNFGLYHCHVPDCVMRSSTYVEDIDLKNGKLCTDCHNLLNI